MTPTTDPAKRVPKSLGTDANLIGEYTLTDLVVAGGPAVFVIVLTQLVLPTTPTVVGLPVTIPLAVTGLAAGVILVSLTPSYTPTLPWLERILQFGMSDRDLPHEEAKQHTRVERLLSGSNALERSDSAVVGAVSVAPVSMGLATAQDWSRKTDAFADFLNTTVDFPIQLYSTTRTFPVEAHLSRYESRLSDPDVESNPRLEALIEHYLDWYEAEHQRRLTTIRDHYVVVAVSPGEVTVEYDGFLGAVADRRALGWLVRAVADSPRPEARSAMVAELDDRLTRVVRGLSCIDGGDARRLQTDELLPLLGNFWVGPEAEDGEHWRRCRRTPLVGGGDR